MNRPIKYQVWDRQAKTMYTHDMLRFSDSLDVRIGKDGLFLVDTALEDEDGYDYEVDAVFLQWTGLTDRNGKEIYEGDIVRVENGKYTGLVKFNEQDLSYVIEDKTGGYGFVNGQTFDERPEYRTYEVIGNIYTHPHLLEVSNG